MARSGRLRLFREPGRDRPAENSGCIEIEFGNGARLRVRGAVAPETLRQVIALLR